MCNAHCWRAVGEVPGTVVWHVMVGGAGRRAVEDASHVVAVMRTGTPLACNMDCKIYVNRPVENRPDLVPLDSSPFKDLDVVVCGANTSCTDCVRAEGNGRDTPQRDSSGQRGGAVGRHK